MKTYSKFFFPNKRLEKCKIFAVRNKSSVFLAIKFSQIWFLMKQINECHRISPIFKLVINIIILESIFRIQFGIIIDILSSFVPQVKKAEVFCIVYLCTTRDDYFLPLYSHCVSSLILSLAYYLRNFLETKKSATNIFSSIST